jgi:uncharacterized membrane protein YccC
MTAVPRSRERVKATPTRRIVRGAFEFDRDGFHLARGIRFGLAVGVPLFLGVATGYIVEGVAASAGALMVGLTDSGAPYRQRVPAMLIATLGVAISTFVGEVTGGYDVVAVLLLALASFGAGMFVAVDLSTYFVAMMSPLAITLVAAFPADALHSLERAALVALGALFTVLLVLVSWRANAHLPERTAIARLYRALAAWVRDEDSDQRAPVLISLDAARRTLDAAQGRVAVPGSAGEALRVLIDEADRLYPDLVAVRTSRRTVEAWEGGSLQHAFEVGRDAVADALVAIAEAVAAGRWKADAESVRANLDESVAVLRDELTRRRVAGDTGHAEELDSILRRGASVRAELRGAVDLAASWSRGDRVPHEDPVRHAAPRRSELRTHHVRSILRANLTLQSSAFRHALRLSVTVAIGATIARAFGLPRGYWIPLTVLFVLRPDFGSTFSRGFQRYLGTAIGAVLATLIAAAFDPGPYALATLATLLAVAVSAFLFANYGLFTLSITAWIIFVAAFAGNPEFSTAIDRLVDTTIGATLTLGLYALWPTWERSTLPLTVADLIEADRAYVSRLFDSWLTPGAHARESVRSARARARLARTNTEASVQRALFEPGSRRAGVGTDRPTGILANMRRFADGALGLEAYLADGPVVPAPVEARPLAEQFDSALAELASAARERRSPTALPPLRDVQQTLAAQVASTSPIAEETDRMVNSLLLTADVMEQAQGGGRSAHVFAGKHALSRTRT